MKTKDKIFFASMIVIILAVLSFSFYQGEFEPKPEKTSEQKKNLTVWSYKNEVELKNLWQFKLDEEISQYHPCGNVLYIKTFGDTIYAVDSSNLKIIKSFKAPGKKEDHFSVEDIKDGILVESSSDEIVVFDLKKEELLLNYKLNGFFTNLDYGILIYDDLVIFADSGADTTYAINYRTGEIVWTHERKWKSGSIHLYRYKDRYLYEKSNDNIFYEFDPKNGDLIGEYPYNTKELINEDHDKQTYGVDFFENMKDKELQMWLEGLSGRTGEGYLYSTYETRFYYHGRSINALSKIEFPNEIDEEFNYGRYMLLDLSDRIVLLDFKSGNVKILWSMKVESGLAHRCFIHGERLYVSNKDRVQVFDLSKLKK